MKDIHQDTEVLDSGSELEDADKVVIMLHGRGATAHGIMRLEKQLPEAAYLAPQAANRKWYPRGFLEPREQNQPDLDSALRKVHSLVEKASSHVGKDNVYLLGFSQGGCLASEYVASNPASYGGLIVLSGGLIGEGVREFEGDLEEISIFIGCSENDPHIPLERVEKTEEVFRDLNADVDKKIFEGSKHGIFEYELEAASQIMTS
ncbi:MAG: dienelactone hydrolase family protein [Nanohaloarchaea archaeon]|nr:dienelactone hydrolase family protein [Candidatus Nanohaloarchaea archaeon]